MISLITGVLYGPESGTGQTGDVLQVDLADQLKQQLDGAERWRRGVSKDDSTSG